MPRPASPGTRHAATAHAYPCPACRSTTPVKSALALALALAGLTDFGLSKERVSGNYDGVSTLCGTAEYMAPVSARTIIVIVLVL